MPSTTTENAATHVGSVQPSRPALPSVLGDCAIRLSHATSYEPPLYLFPQLLPQVPQGSAPIMVWDAVAGAVDVGASYWHMADASSLFASTSGKKNTTLTGPSSKKGTATTLAALLSSNRLVPLGLHASVLENGTFSAASMMQELVALQERAGLSDEESTVLMSNHFVNLLAWKKLREINEPAPCVLPNGSPSRTRGGVDGTALPSSTTTGTTTSKKATSSRKRARTTGTSTEAHEEDAEMEEHAADDTADVLARLQASPDPWTEVVNDPALASTFIAGQETDVEVRVELLRTLSALYRKPWRQLRSAGVQTELVVPPGTVNTTSPYADHRHVTGAQLEPEKHLNWIPTAPSMQPCRLRTQPVGKSEADADAEADAVAAPAAPFSVVVTRAAADDASDNAADAFALTASTTYFGKAAGPQRTAGMGAVCVDVGLAQYTARPELLSEVHFALMLRPVFGVRVPHHGQPSAETAEATKAQDADSNGPDDDEEKEEGTGSSPSPSQSAATGTSLVHTKSPSAYKLLLVNYGRNGVRVVGRRWVFGDVIELVDGDELRVGADSVAIKIAAAGSCHVAGADEALKHDPGLTPVKREELGE